jgi:aldehyde dehydrogenase (NAD+)
VLAELLHAVFAPEEVYVVQGGREENQALLEENFDYIFFTGGKAVGRLELGGKSPCIVDETADIPLAARRIVWGKFLNCGQTCVAPDYLLVHAAVEEKLVAALEANIRALYGENPLESKDYGRIINQKHYDRLCGLIDGSVTRAGAPTADERGSLIQYDGGRDPEHLRLGPVILRRVSWSDPVMGEEIFGPILPVRTFRRLDDAIGEINAGPKPLALYLFTRSSANERKVLERVSFGGGCINDTIMHLASSRLPFGGVGESGMGRYHGKYSFAAFTHEKGVLHQSCRLDMPVRYPPYDRSLKLLRLFLH